MDSVLALHPADPGSIPGVPDRNLFSPCSLYLLTALLRIKLTVQKLNNVDWSHLELLDSATKNPCSITATSKWFFSSRAYDGRKKMEPVMVKCHDLASPSRKYVS